MTVQRRVYFSLPTTTQQDGIDTGLTGAQWDLIQGLAEKIKELGYSIEVFARFGISDSPATTMKWTYDEVKMVMSRCVGSVFVGLPRWILGEWRLATEYSYFEAGMAVTLGLPRLVLVEEGLMERVVFDKQYEFLAWFPQMAGPAWLESPEFKHAFAGWKKQLDRHRDVFLGYSGRSAGLAKNIKLYLEHLGTTVLDWKTYFSPGTSILQQIQEAAQRCSGGIFLFTKDDQLVGSGEQVAPRDNVVFEAGYFAAARGKQRVLIVREQDAKMPADLGGDIYASIDDPADITPAEMTLHKFVEERLYNYDG